MRNITPDDAGTGVDEALFKEAQERALWESFKSVKDKVAGLTSEARYPDAINTMLKMNDAM